MTNVGAAADDEKHGIAQGRKHLVFYVNGGKREVFDVQPETTLLQYLRASGLTGGLVAARTARNGVIFPQVITHPAC